MIDKKRFYRIRDELNNQLIHDPDITILDVSDTAWLLSTIEELQDEVGSLDEQLDRCRRYEGEL